MNLSPVPSLAVFVGALGAGSKGEPGWRRFLLLLVSAAWLWPSPGIIPASLCFAVLIFLSWTWPLKNQGSVLALAGPSLALLLSPPPLGLSRLSGGLWSPVLPWLLGLSLLGPLARHSLRQVQGWKGPQGVFGPSVPSLDLGIWRTGAPGLRALWAARPGPGPELAEVLVLSLLVAAAFL